MTTQTPKTPDGWTQKDSISPWWSRRLGHLDLQVNTRHDSLYAWQVWEGNVCAARGTSPDLPQATLDCEQAAQGALAPPTWTSRFPGGIEWSCAALCTLNLQVVPEEGSFFWVVFDGTAPLAQGNAADRALAQQAATFAAREILTKRAERDGR